MVKDKIDRRAVRHVVHDSVIEIQIVDRAAGVKNDMIPRNKGMGVLKSDLFATARYLPATWTGRKYKSSRVDAGRGVLRTCRLGANLDGFAIHQRMCAATGRCE